MGAPTTRIPPFFDTLANVVGKLPAANAPPGMTDQFYLRQQGLSRQISSADIGGGGGSGAFEQVNSFGNITTTHVPPPITFIQTAGFTTPGDGGGASYIVAPSQSFDPDIGAGKVQSADGRWWQYVPESRGVNCRSFGAIPDASNAFGSSIVTGTDSTVAIQKAIDFALRYSIRRVFLLGGAYKVTNTLHMGWGNTLYSIDLEGDNSVIGATLAGTSILFTATDRQCVNIAGARGSTIRGIFFFYPSNYYYVYNNVWVHRPSAGFTASSSGTSLTVSGWTGGKIYVGYAVTCPSSPGSVPTGTVITAVAAGNGNGVYTTNNVTTIAAGTAAGANDPISTWILPSDPNAWVNPALTNALAQRCPIAAVTVDAFAGGPPTPGYPTPTFPSWTGISSPYNSTAFSSGVKILNCEFQGWPVGIAVGVNTDAQGDFTVIHDTNISLGAYGVAICNSQSRNVDVKNLNFQFLNTLLTNDKFGSGAGEWEGPILNLSGGESYQVFDFNGAAGALEIGNVYWEGGLRRIGMWNSSSKLTLTNWGGTFDDSQYGMERALIEVGTNNAQITFQGCSFVAGYGIQHLVFGSSARILLGPGNVLESGAQFVNTTVLGWQARAYGGGYILNGVANIPSAQNRVSGTSSAAVPYSGGYSLAAWSDTEVATNDIGGTIPAGIGLFREGLLSFRDIMGRKWDIIQTSPIITPISTLFGSGHIQKTGGGPVSGISQAGNTLTFTYSYAGFEAFHGPNNYSINVGDIIVDEPTGTMFVITVKNGAVTQYVYTAIQLNNYNNYLDTGFQDLSSLYGGQPVPTSGGYFRIIRTFINFPTSVYFGTFTPGSTSVTNVTSGAASGYGFGDGLNVSNELPVGMLLFAPETVGMAQAITNEWPVAKNTFITVANNAAPANLTLSIASTVTATGRYPVSPIGLSWSGRQT